MNPVPMHSTGRSTRRKAERQSRRPTAYALANSVYAVGVGVERATRVTCARYCGSRRVRYMRSEEHTSELQSQSNLVCRLLLEKKKMIYDTTTAYATGLSTLP